MKKFILNKDSNIKTNDLNGECKIDDQKLQINFNSVAEKNYSYYLQYEQLKNANIVLNSNYITLEKEFKKIKYKVNKMTSLKNEEEECSNKDEFLLKKV